MTMRKVLIAALGATTISWTPDAEASRVLPRSLPPDASTPIYVADITFMDVDVQLALISLQGLANAPDGPAPSRPKLYLFTDPHTTFANRWLYDYYKKIGAIRKNNTVLPHTEQALLDLFSEPSLAATINGIAVIPVCDPHVGLCLQHQYTRYGWSLNAATNAAGVEKLAIIPAPLLDRVCGAYDPATGCAPGTPLAGKRITRDFRTIPEMQDPYLAAWWSAYNFLSRQSSEALANVSYYDTGSHMVTRDYLIAHKIHTFWWPNSEELDSLEVWPELDAHIRHVLQHAPANIPVLGSWFYGGDHCPGPVGRQFCGPGEVAGVRTAGRYGKYSLGLGYGGGYSFHSGIAVDVAPSTNSRIRQHRRRARPWPTYDPNKKYVTLTMIDSGDSPDYLQTGLYAQQWGDPFRGAVPYSLAITPTILDLGPGLAQYIYETATHNEYLFTAMSGLGYMFPLVHDTSTPDGPGELQGYGDLGILNQQEQITMARAELLRDHYAKLNSVMTDLDLDVLGLYSHDFPTPFSQSQGHPRQDWVTADEDDIASYILPQLPRLNAIASDMGRVDNVTSDTVGNACGFRPNRAPLLQYSPPVSLHHALTRWWQPGPDDYLTPKYGIASEPSLFPYSPDSDAVTWLSSDIRRAASSTSGSLDGVSCSPTGSGSRFIHAVALSWHYGPRRLYQLMKSMTQEGYEFVTFDDFVYLWRVSKGGAYYGYPLPTKNPHGVAPGWCTHPGSRLVRGDLNNDSVDDEICNDSSGYWWSRARPGSGSAISGSELNSLTAIRWCAGDAARLFTADWNNDGVADFLCYYIDNPKLRYFADSHGPGGSYTFRNTYGDPFWNTFCTHQGAWLETALDADIHPLSPEKKLVCHDQAGNDWHVNAQYPW